MSIKNSDKSDNGPNLRLAILVSHPIGYLTSLYQRIARLPGVNVKVWYACDWGLKSYRDPGFGMEIHWNNIIFDDYEYEFLPQKTRPDRLSFRTVDSPLIGQRLSDFGADSVLVHGYAHRLHWRAAAWCRRNGKTSLMLSDSTIGNPPKFHKRMLKQIFVRYFYRYLDGALYVGDNNRAYHESYGMPRDRLFPAILTCDWESMISGVGDVAEARRRVREKYGISEKAFVLMFCGKLYPGKRPGDLVAALERLSKSGTGPGAEGGNGKLVCFFAGSGVLEEELRRRSAQAGLTNIHWLGFVPPEELPAYYAASDVLVMCSELEAHPLVVSEATAFGLPVILSDRIGAIGPNDVAREGINALVYPVGRPDVLAERILTLADNSELYMRMSANARNIAGMQTLDASARAVADAAFQLRRLGPRNRRRGS